MSKFVLSALVAAFAAFAAQPAAAFFWGPLYNNPEIGQLGEIPPCTEPGLHTHVVDRFNEVEATYWNNRHAMTRVTRMRPVGHHPQRDDKVARRWCEGTAHFADGRSRRIVLELGSSTGFAGQTYSLTYCVDGLDRHMTHAPACRVLRHREF